MEIGRRGCGGHCVSSEYLHMAISGVFPKEDKIKPFVQNENRIVTCKASHVGGSTNAVIPRKSPDVDGLLHSLISLKQSQQTLNCLSAW